MRRVCSATSDPTHQDSRRNFSAVHFFGCFVFRGQGVFAGHCLWMYIVRIQWRQAGAAEAAEVAEEVAEVAEAVEEDQLLRF